MEETSASFPVLYAYHYRWRKRIGEREREKKENDDDDDVTNLLNSREKYFIYIGETKGKL